MTHKLKHNSPLKDIKDSCLIAMKQAETLEQTFIVKENKRWGLGNIIHENLP
jgi:hypothetical protein